MTGRFGFVATALFGAMAMSVTPARADTIDLFEAQLNGVLTLNNGANNQFDPANGHVPAGFGNSLFADGGSGEPFALVSDSKVEFGYLGASTFQFTVDFTTGGAVTVSTQNTVSPFGTIGVGIISPSLPGLSFQPTSTTPFGGCGLAGNALSCNFTSVTAPFVFTGQLSSEVVPEPASLALLGLGLAGVAVRSRKARQR